MRPTSRTGRKLEEGLRQGNAIIPSPAHIELRIQPLLGQGIRKTREPRCSNAKNTAHSHSCKHCFRIRILCFERQDLTIPSSAGFERSSQSSQIVPSYSPPQPRRMLTALPSKDEICHSICVFCFHSCQLRRDNSTRMMIPSKSSSGSTSSNTLSQCLLSWASAALSHDRVSNLSSPRHLHQPPRA